MSGRSPRWFTGIQYPWEDNFSDNTWAQIIEVCQKGIVPATWKVGNQKAMTIGGSTYMIDIIGILHDDYADGSGKAPLTFQLHGKYNTVYAMNASNTNKGGWTESQMRVSRMPAILARMPPEVQAAIREVSKLTSAGGKSETIETTADKLFLLSEVEVIGEASASFAGEGAQYSYYATYGSAAQDMAWSLRSPSSASSSYFLRVSKSGGITKTSASNNTGNVIPAFCF